MLDLFGYGCVCVSFLVKVVMVEFECVVVVEFECVVVGVCSVVLRVICVDGKVICGMVWVFGLVSMVFFVFEDLFLLWVVLLVCCCFFDMVVVVIDWVYFVEVVEFDRVLCSCNVFFKVGEVCWLVVGLFDIYDE